MDHALNSGWQVAPVQRGGCPPTTLVILPQVAALLHCTQQFYRKQGMTVGLLKECLPESLSQVVGFRINQRVHKLLVDACLDSIQVNGDITVDTGELVHHRL